MENVIKLTDKTQRNLFKNTYELNRDVIETEKVYCREQKKKVEINRIVQTSLEKQEMFRDLNEYDRAVHNAVCSFVEVGVYTFTTEQLYRVMCGDENKQIENSESPIRKDIEKSLNQLSFRRIKIDFAEEDEIFKLGLTKKDGTKITAFKGYILPLEEYTLKLKNGKTTTAWKLLGFPPMYSYAKAKKQVATFCASHLNIPLKIDGGSIALREYLLDRVLAIKRVTTSKGTLRRGYENANVILFSSVYELLGEEGQGKTSAASHQRKRILEKCEKIFDYWKNETGLLSEWDYSKRGEEGKADAFVIKINMGKFLEDRITVEADDIACDGFDINLSV